MRGGAVFQTATPLKSIIIELSKLLEKNQNFVYNSLYLIDPLINLWSNT